MSTEQQPEALQLADDLDRMYDQLDPVDDWRPAISAACDELRRQHAKIKRLTAERDALRGVPTELIACLIDARDDVAAELQRCREAAGYPSTDRRLAAQETLIARVDSAIAAAELAAQQPPVQSVSVENQALLELAAEIDKRFQSLNPVPVEKAVVPASEWKALLTLLLAQSPAQPVKRLTPEEIDKLRFAIPTKAVTQRDHEIARAVETACASAWGEKLEGAE